MVFQTVDPRFNLEVANFGSGNDRVLIFRAPNAPDEWEQIDSTRTILIGGAVARRELKRMLDSRSEGLGRPALQDRIPGGINSRTHTAMRKFFNL